MRPSTKLVGALAVAGIVAAGGTALTAGNTIPDTIGGYGSNTISGVTASNVAYVREALDASQLQNIVFTLNPAMTTIVGYEAKLTINGDLTTTYACTLDSDAQITCADSANIGTASLLSIGLTVTHT